MATVPVYQWMLGGKPFGCGTKREFDYWAAEGINPAGLTLGKVIGHEPASEDARRQIAWAA